MTYHRGTLAQFDTWHTAAKTSAGITPEGKVGFVNGVPAPDKQRTIAYSEAIAHPSNVDDYIWPYSDYQDGTVLTADAVKTAGWFPEELQ